MSFADGVLGQIVRTRAWPWPALASCFRSVDEEMRKIFNLGKSLDFGFFLRQCMSIGGWGSFAAVFGENFLFPRMWIVTILLVLDSSKCGGGLFEMMPGPGKLFCDDWWGVWKVVFVQSFFRVYEAIATANGFFLWLSFLSEFFDWLRETKTQGLYVMCTSPDREVREQIFWFCEVVRECSWRARCVARSRARSWRRTSIF